MNEYLMLFKKLGSLYFAFFFFKINISLINFLNENWIILQKEIVLLCMQTVIWKNIYMYKLCLLINKFYYCYVINILIIESFHLFKFYYCK